MRILEDLFIPPGRNLNAEDSDIRDFAEADRKALVDRWKTPKGQDILSKWRDSYYSRETLDGLIGKYYDHTDIRGINLSKAELKKADLSYVDMFRANLEKANLESANLEESWLSESIIRGANFKWAKMDGVIIDNAISNSKTNFTGVNTNSINFTFAAMVQDVALTQNRIASMERQQPVLAYFLRVTSDYGRAFFRFLLWCLGVILLFGYIYFLVPGAIALNNQSVNLGNSIYFSFVVFTTLGFGDILPVTTLGRSIVILEVTIGYIMLGLLIAILSRRVFGS